jgi:hypothetical protein
MNWFALLVGFLIGVSVNAIARRVTARRRSWHVLDRAGQPACIVWADIMVQHGDVIRFVNRGEIVASPLYGAQERS